MVLAPAFVDVDLRAGAADQLCKHCKPAADTRDGTTHRDVGALSFGSDAGPNCPSTAHREHHSGRAGRCSGTGCRVRGNANAAYADLSGSSGCAHRRRAVPASHRWFACCGLVAADRHFVRRGAGLDCGASKARRRSAQQRADNGNRSFFIAARTGGRAGSSVTGSAGGRRIVFAKPEQIAEYRPEAGDEKPLRRAHQPTGGGIFATAIGSAVPNHGGPLPCACPAS